MTNEHKATDADGNLWTMHRTPHGWNARSDSVNGTIIGKRLADVRRGIREYGTDEIVKPTTRG